MYTLIGEELYCIGKDGVLKREINVEEAKSALESCHDGTCRGHFATNITIRKILQSGMQ